MRIIAILRAFDASSGFWQTSAEDDFVAIAQEKLRRNTGIKHRTDLAAQFVGVMTPKYLKLLFLRTIASAPFGREHDVCAIALADDWYNTINQCNLLAFLPRYSVIGYTLKDIKKS